MTNEYIYKGKVIGQLSEDGTLIKRGKQIQLMRAYDAYGVEVDVVEDPRVQRIEWHIDKSNKIGASTDDIIRYNFKRKHGTFDEQYFVPTKRTKIEDRRQEKLL